MFKTLEERKEYARNFAVLLLILTIGIAVLFFIFRKNIPTQAGVAYVLNMIGESLLGAFSACSFYHGLYVIGKKAQRNTAGYLGAPPSFTITSVMVSMPYGFLGMVGFLPYYVYNLYLIKKAEHTTNSGS